MAALDRQHPRDLFDVMILLENEGISDRLFRTWLAYLVGHKGSMADALAPNRKDIGALFHSQFVAMTEREIALEELLDVRERLIVELHARLREREREFLLSVKRGEPRSGLLGLDGVERLPAVKWKLHTGEEEIRAASRATAERPRRRAMGLPEEKTNHGHE